MTTLRTIKQLLLGETWILPVGLAITLAAAGLLRTLASTPWQHLGGLLLLAAVLVVLVASVERSARGR
jgi:hypothetical protein